MGLLSSIYPSLLKKESTIEVLIPGILTSEEPILAGFRLLARVDSQMTVSSDDIKIKDFILRILHLFKLEGTYSILTDISWEIDFSRDSKYYNIVEYESSALAFSLAIYNMLRKLYYLPHAHKISGSGMLRSNGTFVESAHCHEKERICRENGIKNFTPLIIPNLASLHFCLRS